MRHKRLSAALAVGTFAVVGCGGDQPSIGGSEGATPVETAEPVPIEATGTGDDGVEPINPAGDATNIRASYIFTFADDLVLPTNDGGYVYRANAAVDNDALGRVANFFGVATDSVVNWDEEAITEDSPTIGMGYTATDPLQTWSYFDSAATATLTECVVDPNASDPNASDPNASEGTTDPTGDVLGDEACVSPADPPEGVPDQAGAEAKMTEMLTAIGVDPGSVEMATYADPFVATVEAAELDSAGIKTGRNWTLGIAGGGKPYAASGPLAVPQPVGPYPLVGIDVATARLGGGWAGGGVISDGGPADSGDGDNKTGEGTGGDDKRELPVDQGPIASMPPAEPVNIVDVEADRVWLWDANGDAWMVPGYRFLDAAQNQWSVPAIADDLLEAPSVSKTPDGTDAADTLDGVTTPPTTGVGEPEDSSAPTLAPDAKEALEALVGVATLAEFTAAAENFGLTVRVSKVAGTSKMLTMDFNPSRVNVEVDQTYNTNRDSARVIGIESIG